MKVGVPKEVKPNEHRVGLTPASVREFTAHGHAVIVQSGAGEGIGAGDDAYRGVGGQIASNAADIFATADLIVKVKEPQRSELVMLRPDQVLFTYLHLAADPDLTDGLVASGCTAVAYETVVDAHGALPLLAPMSEVAGRLAVEAAALALRKHEGGMGRLLGGVPGVPPARVLILGGGVVGTHAARMAAGLDADVVVVDKSLERLREIEAVYGRQIRTRYSTLEAIDEEIRRADAVIGAVLVVGARAPKLVNRAQLANMRPGAVLVDVSIDQGGCFETSHPTTHHAPTFVVDGIVHYCVANMPGAVPVTSTHALNNATLPFGLALADKGLDALRDDPVLRGGVNVHRGRVTHRAVADSLGRVFVDSVQALAS